MNKLIVSSIDLKMLRKSLFLSSLLTISVITDAQQNPNYRILPYNVNPVQYERSPLPKQPQQQDGFDLKQVNLMKAIHVFSQSIVHDNFQKFSMHHSYQTQNQNTVKLQCPPLLFRITLDQNYSNNNNRMIQLTDTFCVLFRYNGTRNI